MGKVLHLKKSMKWTNVCPLFGQGKFTQFNTIINNYSRLTLMLILCTHSRTTKNDVFTNIFFVKQKPKPLGTEFKNFCCCAILRVQRFLELQEGKYWLKSMNYFQRLGTTSACVRCILEAAVKFCKRKKEEEKKKL